MATGTVALNAGMVEYRVPPAEGAMAVATILARLDMIRGLADSGGAIVAGLAAAPDSEVIHLRYRIPLAGLVTELAITRGIDVIGGWSRRLYGPFLAVTAAALLGCSAEHAIDVTAFAICLGMAKIQRKGRIVMIEVLLRIRQQRRPHDQQKYQQPPLDDCCITHDLLL